MLVQCVSALKHLKQIIELPGKFSHLIQLCWNRKSVGTVNKRSLYNWAEELGKTGWSDSKWIYACWQMKLNEQMIQQLSVEVSTLKKVWTLPHKPVFSLLDLFVIQLIIGFISLRKLFLNYLTWSKSCF